MVSLIIARLPINHWLRLALIGISLVFFFSFLLPAYAYLMFSQHGGNFQEKLYNLILQHAGEVRTGKALDIGAGNGAMAVLMAQRFPQVAVTGMDYWGDDWEFSKDVCEQNTRAANVADRVSFQKGDAASLDFPDNIFDLAVSNLTFHEVKSIEDKKDVLQEALRVVKPGGRFAFLDYFFENDYYGGIDTLEQSLIDLGVSEYTLQPLHEKMDMPILLKHPKILGGAGILYGNK